MVSTRIACAIPFATMSNFLKRPDGGKPSLSMLDIRRGRRIINVLSIKLHGRGKGECYCTIVISSLSFSHLLFLASISRLTLYVSRLTLLS